MIKRWKMERIKGGDEGIKKFLDENIVLEYKVSLISENEVWIEYLTIDTQDEY